MVLVKMQYKQDLLTSGQGEKWVNSYETSPHKIVTDGLLYSSSLKQQAWYVVDEVTSCQLVNSPRHACQIVETSNMAKENLNIGVETPVQKEPFCPKQIQFMHNRRPCS